MPNAGYTVQPRLDYQTITGVEGPLVIMDNVKFPTYGTLLPYIDSLSIFFNRIRVVFLRVFSERTAMCFWSAAVEAAAGAAAGNMDNRNRYRIHVSVSRRHQRTKRNAVSDGLEEHMRLFAAHRDQHKILRGKPTSIKALRFLPSSPDSDCKQRVKILVPANKFSGGGYEHVCVKQ